MSLNQDGLFAARFFKSVKQIHRPTMPKINSNKPATNKPSVGTPCKPMLMIRPIASAKKNIGINTIAVPRMFFFCDAMTAYMPMQETSIPNAL